MAARTIELKFNRGAASRGTGTVAAVSDDEQRRINEAAGELFSVETIATETIAAARSGGDEVSTNYAADQIVRVELADGGQLWITIERLQELTGQSGDTLVLESGTALGRGGGPSRGITDWIRKVSFVDIAWGDDLKDTAANVTVMAAIAKIESGLLDGRTGVYRCDFSSVEPRFEAVNAPVGYSETPLLVLLHGTASSTAGSFSGLWSGANRSAWLNSIERLYDNRVLTLEHRTLSESPIKNACVLLNCLAPGQPVHLISHSRGGLVGELLCRAMLEGRADPVTKQDIERYLSAYSGNDPDVVAARALVEEEIAELNSLLIQKRPQVRRFVRVACPSRGTTLAAKRLDVYLNLMLSGLKMAGTHVLGPLAGKFIGALNSLVIAVAHKRFDDELLPGIKAMVPDGGLARFINDPRIKVDADLAVIGGNSEIGGGLRQTILVALSNLYYWQANDWVVETDAMTGGHPREAPGWFFLDDGSKVGDPVNHFSYFRNKHTFNALIQALAGNHPMQPGWKSLAAEPVKTKSRGELTAEPTCVTVMLPGLPGSHLAEDGQRIWLHPLRIAFGEMDRLEVHDPENDVLPDGWLNSRYENLADYLRERRHRVVVFDYDWRLSLPANSERLGALIQKLTRDKSIGSLNLRLLGHSVGGWVALHWLTTDNRGLWDRLCKEQDARLVMAGTPLQGTFDSLQLLTARHPLLNMLAAVDFEHNRYELIDKLRHFPGLLETFPGDAIAGADWNFFDDRSWDRFKPALNKRWKRPAAGALRKAFGVRQQVNVDSKPLHAGRVLYLVGQDNATPDGLEIDNGRLDFSYTSEGDGLTLWASIPQWLKENQCWYLPRVKHGDLFCTDDVFPAIRDLLESGNTRLVPQRPPAAARGGVAEPDVGPETPVLYPTATDLEAAALHGTSVVRRQVEPTLPRCNVRIRHGNLRYADLPVMVGHYEDDGIGGSEAALDGMLDGRLSKLHRVNLYPGPLNTVEITTEPGTYRQGGAVVVGLGPVGRLSAYTLQQTLQNAVVRYGLDQAEKLRQVGGSQDVEASLALASLVIGSGTGGVTLADAVKALLEAVAGANRLLSQLDAPPLQQLDIVELYEDQAVAIAHTCSRIGDDVERAFDFDLYIGAMKGRLARPYFAEQAPWWRRMLIRSEEGGWLNFAPLTDKAAIDEEAQATQTTLIDAMLADVTGTTADNPRLAESLFELLVPNALKAQVEAQGGMVMLVNDGAARYPWELLANRRSREHGPLATRIGLIRQLFDRSGDPGRATVHNRKALVVGDTQSGEDFVDLPAAVTEARVVCDQLNGGGFDAGPEPLIRRPGVEIIMALTNDDYQIIHLAGHGVVDYPMTNPDSGIEEKKTGMVLGNGIVLGAKEIKALGSVPELVFINCCHLGANEEPLATGPRNELAAKLGTAFIRAGARCVVAAGWEVSDAAAALFAETFYARMLSGDQFGDAVTVARQRTYKQHRSSNTWGAYQCYGDHAFVLNGKKSSQNEAAKEFFSAREVEIEAANICGKASWADASESNQPDLVRAAAELAEQVASQAHLRTGASCAAVASAYHELGDFEQSVNWNEQAQLCEDGRVPVKSLERQANALARLAEQKANRQIAGETPDASLLRLRMAAEMSGKAAEMAEGLLRLGPTRERANLGASAHKHHGFVNAAIASSSAPRSERRTAARNARNSLFRAYELYRAQADRARSETGLHDSYPLLNAGALWLYLDGQERLPQKLRAALQSRSTFGNELKALSDQFAMQPIGEGDQRFWDRTDRINLGLYQALVKENLHLPARHPRWQKMGALYSEEFKLASRREADSVTKQIRFLLTLLGKKTDSLKALAKLYESLEREDSGVGPRQLTD